MGDYLRTTRECSLADLSPLLITAVHTHLEKNNLEAIEDAVLICCETVSTKQKQGLFGKKTETVHSAVILTPKWLIWAAGKENETPGVLSARLNNLQIEDYEGSSMYQMMPDTGLNISGFHTTAGLGTIFVGLGPEPAARKFRKQLKAAMAML